MKIVIVGGGFAGVKAALELSKVRGITVTLVTERDHFLFYPALYATATGKSRRQSILPLQKVFRGKNVKIIISRVTSIDAHRRLLVTDDGQLSYDKVIFALGVVTSYFGIEGLDTYSYSIKSTTEIQKFKQHLHQEATEHKLDKNYVIVGAGATGVELSAALAQYLKRIAANHDTSSKKVRISLVEAAPRVLPRMSEAASRSVESQLKKRGITVMTNKFVQEADEDSVMVSGREIDTKTIVWTSGVANNPFFSEHLETFTLAKNGRVVVDEHLRAHKHIYVIGDNANTPFTGLAQTAIYDAVYIKKLIQSLVSKQKSPSYRPRRQPVVIPIGENWAVLEYGRIRITGYIASLIRRAADFVGYLDYFPVPVAARLFLSRETHDEDCPVCW